MGIATLATLPASSPRSSPRSTREPVRPLKRPHNSSNLRKPLSSSSFHRSQWLSSPLLIRPTRKIRRQRHETDCRRRCYQGSHQEATEDPGEKVGGGGKGKK